MSMFEILSRALESNITANEQGTSACLLLGVLAG